MFAAMMAGSFLSGCATPVPSISTDLSAAEVFQRAQDASSQGDYPLAMEYYKLYQQKFPEDRDHGTWAAYEIAFLYHKLGNDAKARELIDTLLGQYAADPTLPAAPRVLAQKVKTEIEAKLQKTP